MKIGVDLDNVVFTFQPFWGELYNHWYDKHVNVDLLVDWDDLITQTHFEKYSEFFAWFDRAEGWAKMPMERGAAGGLDELVAKGHSLTFITARSAGAFDETARWVQTCPWGTAVRSKMVFDKADKWNVPCGVYIDDSPSVINGLIDAGKPVVIFDKPWNKTIPKPAPCPECNGAATLEYPTGEIPFDTVTKPCPFCKGSGHGSRVWRATSWAKVVEIIEAFSHE